MKTIMTKKEALLNKNFSKILWLKIITLQILFLLFGFILVGAGHGTYIQFPVFYGWLFLPVALGFVVDEISRISSFYALLVPILFFLLSVKIVHIVKFGTKKDLVKIVSYHIAGALLSILIVEFSGNVPLSSSVKIKAIASCIAFIFAFIFWSIFFKAKSKINKQTMSSDSPHKPQK